MKAKYTDIRLCKCKNCDNFIDNIEINGRYLNSKYLSCKCESIRFVKKDYRNYQIWSINKDISHTYIDFNYKSYTYIHSMNYKRNSRFRYKGKVMIDINHQLTIIDNYIDPEFELNRVIKLLSFL